MRVVIDRLKLWESEFRRLLAPGETPLVAVSCQVAFGADRLERTPEEVEHLFRYLPRGVREEATAALHAEPTADRQGWRRALERAVDIVTGDLITADPDQMIGGVAAAGHVGSYAHRLSSALGSGTNYAVVSDSRLLFARRQASGEFVELAALPRHAVLAARRAGRIFQRGRVVLDFVDLSQLALMAGVLATGPADRLVSAISGGVARDSG